MNGRLFLTTNSGITSVVLRADEIGLQTKVVEADVTNGDMSLVFLEWLRSVDKETQMKVFAAITLEYTLAAHITTNTEEERLAALNMEQEDVIGQIIQAVKEVAKYEVGDYLTVEVSAVYSSLEARHMALPPYVVYSVLKTLEAFGGHVRDIGEGYFRVINL